MSHEVYANNWQVSGQSGMNKSIARFPDVCLSPPSPPAGPIPVPYPDTSFSTDLKKGSKTVKLGRKPAALAQQSYYKAKLLGDEAATKSLGMNVVTHQITGKTYFQAWSMDVKFEGKNVCRHFDITTSNHGSPPPGTPPSVSIEKPAATRQETEDLVNDGKCPCCRGPLHENQKSESGAPLSLQNESDYYQGKADFFRDRAEQLKDPRHAGLESAPLKNDARGMAEIAKFLFPVETPTVANMIRGKARFFDETEKRLAQLRAANPGCPNVHEPPDVGCGAHFADVPKKKRTVNGRKDTPVGHARREFEGGPRNASIRAWQQKLVDAGSTARIPSSDKVNHKTPLEAGGCPVSTNNTVPDTAITALGGPDCMEIENLQTELTNSGA